jgi:hydrocephalus-inducing protein
MVSAGGVLLPLATLSGACVGLELALASDSLPFGTVVLGSKTTKHLQLSNTGDIGTKFAWDAKLFKPHFSIYPAGESGVHFS